MSSVIPSLADSFVTLKYAFFILLAALAVYFVSLIGGIFLSVAIRLVTKIDLSPDLATTTMTPVVAAAGMVVLFTVWSGMSSWIALTAGSVTTFMVGTGIYSRAIKRFAKRRETTTTTPIGLFKALIVSAVVTFVGAAVPVAILLVRALVR